MMAKTKDDIIADIKTGLISNAYKEMEWSDITSAVGSTSPAEKAILVDHMSTRNRAKFADALFKIVSDAIDISAGNEAVQMMADDSVTLADLQKFL